MTKPHAESDADEGKVAFNPETNEEAGAPVFETGDDDKLVEEQSPATAAILSSDSELNGEFLAAMSEEESSRREALAIADSLTSDLRETLGLDPSERSLEDELEADLDSEFSIDESGELALEPQVVEGFGIFE